MPRLQNFLLVFRELRQIYSKKMFSAVFNKNVDLRQSGEIQ